MNWAQYNQIKKEEDRREYNRAQQADWRAKNSKPKQLSRAMKKAAEGGPSPRESAYVAAVERGDETEADRLAEPVRALTTDEIVR